MTAVEVEKSSDWGEMESWLFNTDGDMTEPQVRAAVSKARRYEDEFFRIVGQLHERQAWRAVGYDSWQQFVLEEFGIKRTRAYQLVDQYRVNAALAPASEDQTPRPGPGQELLFERGPVLSEAQARPLAKLKDDERAVRQAWARARVLAGDDEPTKAIVEAAVEEYLNPPDFVAPEAPLVTNRVVWASGPVWWFWQTPEDGTVLYVGLGEPVISDLDRASSTWFRSEPRIGDHESVREFDSGGLLPWVIAELLTGGCEMPDPELVARLVELEFTHLGRGPHQVDKADLLDDDGWDVGPGEWRPISDDDSEDRALEVDDVGDGEVLRGELVDAEPASSPDGTEPIPPGSGSPDLGGVEDDGVARPPVSSASPTSSPATASSLLDDLAAMDVGEVLDALEMAVDVGWNTTRPDDCEQSAAWLRAAASFVMNRKTGLERAAREGAGR